MSFNGKYIQDTQPFIISGSRWRIRYKVTPRAGVSEKYLKVRVRSADGNQSDYLATISGVSQDTLYLTGAGTYTLGVFSHQLYHLQIEETTP